MTLVTQPARAIGPNVKAAAVFCALPLAENCADAPVVREQA
jgi:hypothetical protein